METVSASALYSARRAILEGRASRFYLRRLNDLIAYNATHEFMPYGTVAFVEGLINGTDRAAEGSNRTLH